MALWTNGTPPSEYTDLILMRDVFHCTPAELAEQDADAVMAVLEMLSAEATVNKLRQARSK